MQQQNFCQADIVNCKQHPQRPIYCIYYKKDCPYKSRLACSKCSLENKTTEGFMDIMDVLNDPTLLISNNDQSKGKYYLLNEYFNLLEKDAEQVRSKYNNKFIFSFKEEIFKKIEKLLNDLKEGIEKCNLFKAELIKMKENLQQNEVQECERFKQAFREIIKVDNYHNSEQWKQFEGTVQDFGLKFEDQQIKELNATYDKLEQMNTIFFQKQLLSDFSTSISKCVELLRKNLDGMQVFPAQIFSSLCDKSYWLELIQRIKNKNDVWPKVTLLFKGSQHGLNGQAFWQKCSNKGPTIIICKSQSGCVFGGYTPLKWIPDGRWMKDETKTSFVFSYTLTEIYPITTGEKAIYCDRSLYGPIFGTGNYIRIDPNFQTGKSNMNGQSYSNESYKIDNPNTHLMGGEEPELVEMEVFLVE